MNRRKQTSSLGFPSLILLGIAVVILSASGITYVVMKNKQITARAEIALVRKRMNEHQVVITKQQSEIKKILGVYDLPQLLAKKNSRLRKIDPPEILHEVEEAPASQTLNQDAVARR